MTILNTMAIRLLVADDAPFIRDIVRSAVESKGIVIVGEATDGLEAVEMALRLKPDLVLMDMVMPNQNGLKAAEHILAKNPAQKIVAFSTLGEYDLSVKAINAGCVDFLSKPFEIDELILTITTAVKK